MSCGEVKTDLCELTDSGGELVLAGADGLETKPLCLHARNSLTHFSKKWDLTKRFIHLFSRLHEHQE